MSFQKQKIFCFENIFFIHGIFHVERVGEDLVQGS